MTSSGSSTTDSATTRRPGTAPVRSRTAAGPAAVRRSITATCGMQRRACSTASSTLAATPTTSSSSRRSNRSASPSRYRQTSATTSTPTIKPPRYGSLANHRPSCGARRIQKVNGLGCRGRHAGAEDLVPGVDPNRFQWLIPRRGHACDDRRRQRTARRRDPAASRGACARPRPRPRSERTHRMPQPLTYPGVYVEEVPSGVRTIVGVATSITAFVGTALEGTVDAPVTLHSFADYERRFGGLSAASTLGYAVLDFFRNGGGEALVVRIVADDATAATLTVDSGGNALPLVAASPGAWGNALAATVDYKTRDADSANPDPKLFNLTITRPGGITQRYLNVSVADDDPRYVARVLADPASFVHVKRD